MRCGHTDNALVPKGREDVDGAVLGERIGCVQRGEHLGDLAIAVDFVECIDYVIDLVVDHRIVKAVAAADGGLTVAKRSPGESHARPPVVLVGGQWRFALVHFVPQAKIQSQIGPDVPRVLHIACVKRIEGSHHGISEALLIRLGQSEIEGLQRRNRGAG